MKYINADGPSYEWHTGQYRLAGYAYLAPHEPVRFTDVEQAKNYLASARAEAIAAMPPVDAEKWGVKPITAEGPSSELHTWLHCERPAGWTYLAPHEPVRFEPFDPEITARAMRLAFEPLDEIEQLREQLETARKALEAIREWDDVGTKVWNWADEALAQISAGQVKS